MKMPTFVTVYRRILLLSAVIVFGSVKGIYAEGVKRVFRAGAATSNITPPLGELIVGGWTPIPATHVHDELHARCLVLDDGSDKVAIVLCDNVGIPREVFDLAKHKIHRATGLPKSHVLLAATHTHSATTARGPSKVIQATEFTDYQTFLADRISDGVRRALNHLEPARIGWGTIDEPSEVFNRRWFVNDAALLTNPFGGIDRVRMNPPRGSDSLDRPAGPTDPQISFVTVQSLDARPIALLANYSLHYVGGVRKGDVSADYFGYFAKSIESKLGASEQSPPFVGILSNGTSGDVNNINFTQKNARRYEPYAKMREVAEKVATRVDEAHRQVTFQEWVPLAAAETELLLKVRKPSDAMLKYFEQVNSLDNDSKSARHVRERNYASRIETLKDAPDDLHVPLQAIQIGDLGIVAIPFETFAETGLELKHRSPFGHTFTIELANGSYGYLPTPEQHRLGGYETWLGTNYVEKEASDKIVQTTLGLLESLKTDVGTTTDVSLRIVSYNIKHGEGTDGKLDLGRSAEVLRQLNPDIVGLQEVDDRAARSSNIDQASEFGRRLKLNSAFGPFMGFQGGRYGMAILARYPIIRHDSIELPEGNEPRIALAALVRLPNGDTVMLVNVHFDWVSDDAFRFAQAMKLANYLDELTIPYILLGDFNDTPDSRTLKVFRDRALELTKPRSDRFTFSSTNPRKEIDFIFASPSAKWEVKKIWVHDEPIASDHRPVVADVSYKTTNLDLKRNPGSSAVNQ